MTTEPPAAHELVRGMRVAIDVQHLYRASRPSDRGATFQLADGTSIAEAEAASMYAEAMAMYFRARGAEVLTNNPSTGRLIGEYWQRHAEVVDWGAHVYFACHLNAGRGSYGLIERMVGATQAGRLCDWLRKGLVEIPEILVAKQAELSENDRGAACIRRCARVLPSVLLEPFFGDTPKHQPLLAPLRLREVGETIARETIHWWRIKIGQGPGQFIGAAG